MVVKGADCPAIGGGGSVLVPRAVGTAPGCGGGGPLSSTGAVVLVG